MICKKCLNEISEEEKVCPFCGAAVETEKKPFVVSITDEDFAPIDNSQTDIQSHSGTQAQVPTVFSEQQAQPYAEPQRVYTRQAGEVKQQGDFEHRRKQTAPSVRKAAPKAAKDSKQSIKNDKIIKVIACVCAVFMAVLSVLGMKTDIFKNDSNSTVPLSKLSDEQTASFEEFAKKLTPLFENGYDSTKTVLDDVIDLFNPTDPNGLYASFLGVQSAASDEADPAKRYVGGSSSVAYSKVKSDDISQIAQSIGLNSYDDINKDECYYYGGNYYFESTQSEQSGSSYGDVEVTSSKRTSGDDYYITCNLYSSSATKSESGEYSEEPLKELYFLATPDGEGADTRWTLKKLSDEPLLSNSDSSEPTTADETQEGDEVQSPESLSFEMKSTKFSAKMSDGRVYANYVVEYPAFENDSAVGVTINSIYEETINELKSRINAKKCDKKYAKLIESGVSEDAFPLYTHVIASVEYNENGYVSIFERRTLHTGKEGVTAQTQSTTTAYSASTTQAQQQETVFALPQTTYDGYTFDLSTGDFVKKDDLLGKDFVSAKDTLFNAWLSAGGRLYSADASTYGTLSSGGISGSTAITDTYGLGKAIYESSWLMTSDGITFLFKHSDDALDPVTIERTEPTNTSESQTALEQE